MKSIRAAGLLVLFAIPNLVNAEMTVEAYKAGLGRADLRQIVENYVSGVGRGMWISNYDCKNCHFCPPKEFIAQGSNFMQWVDQEIKVHPPGSINSVEVMLLFRMKEVFPCPKR